MFGKRLVGSDGLYRFRISDYRLVIFADADEIRALALESVISAKNYLGKN